MILYIEDLLADINVMNWYRGEAEKRNDVNADLVQSDVTNQDVILEFVKTAVNDVLMMANPNRVKFLCEYENDALCFHLSPLRKDREYLMGALKEAIRIYIITEVRRLWMMTMKPEWADGSLREELKMRIIDAMGAVTDRGEIVRRRYSAMGL